MRWWIMWRVPVLALVVMAAWWFVFRPLTGGGAEDWVSVDRTFGICGQRGDGPSQGCVIDGDTIAIGFGEGARRIRLTGFDAPELDGACAAESAQAIEARAFLHTWLQDGRIEWSGADETAYDQYGRELREVRRLRAGGGYDYLADAMIDAGMAGASGWGTSPRDWCS
ncbi:MAG: hypothetical protein AAGL68_08570 [Pseudomonadota bacterium]